MNSALQRQDRALLPLCVLINLVSTDAVKCDCIAAMLCEASSVSRHGYLGYICTGCFPRRTHRSDVCEALFYRRAENFSFDFSMLVMWSIIQLVMENVDIFCGIDESLKNNSDAFRVIFMVALNFVTQNSGFT